MGKTILLMTPFSVPLQFSYSKSVAACYDRNGLLHRFSANIEKQRLVVAECIMDLIFLWISLFFKELGLHPMSVMFGGSLHPDLEPNCIASVYPCHAEPDADPSVST